MLADATVVQLGGGRDREEGRGGGGAVVPAGSYKSFIDVTLVFYHQIRNGTLGLPPSDVFILSWTGYPPTMRLKS
jgi:hypothetical protein